MTKAIKQGYPILGNMKYSVFVFSLWLMIQALPADPELIFREDWAETPFALPITQEHVANPDLDLNLYGGAVGGGEGDTAHGLKKSHHDSIDNDPHYVWSGQIRSADWGATLRFQDGRSFDLSGDSTLTWRTRQSGNHCLHVLLRTLAGHWLVSDPVECESADWRQSTRMLESLEWKALDADRIDFGNAVPEANPDLSAVVEIGFTDLKAGNGSAESSRVDWLEVKGYERRRARIASLDSNSRKHHTSIDLANDGNLGTHWMAEGENVFLQAELEAVSPITGIEVAWWKNRERTAYFDVAISKDGESWTTVLADKATMDVGRDFEYYPLPEEIKGRFVRLVGHGNSINEWNSIAELHILTAPSFNPWYANYPRTEDWYNVDWMGFIYADEDPWILHAGLGWVHMVGNVGESFFLWDSSLGWMFTSETLYPNLYGYGNNKWYRFSSGPNPRWFYNLTDGGWFSI